MSRYEQLDIWSKGYDMARAYQRNLGNLYPPGTEDDDDEVGGIGASPPPQNTQDSITNGSKVDADELVVSEGSQAGLHTNFSDASPFEPRTLLEAGLRATGAVEQYSRTNSGPADSIQPGQTPSPMHQTIHNTEDTVHSPCERLDDSHDEDCTGKLPPSGNPAEPAKGPDDVAGTVVHQTLAEGGATPSLSESHTMPTTLPTSAP
ncbi:hypothetical protein BC629DRAFT_1526605 [Irpex lacteus]|nr:hypothetical protein BC629DRAFT_1526605 [Irpex lacteus]